MIESTGLRWCRYGYATTLTFPSVELDRREIVDGMEVK